MYNNNKQKFDIQNIKELSDSLTYDDIKIDYKFLLTIIDRYYPRGDFTVFERVNFEVENDNVRYQPSAALIEFVVFLNMKYANADRVRAISDKIYREYLRKPDDPSNIFELFSYLK